MERRPISVLSPPQTETPKNHCKSRNTGGIFTAPPLPFLEASLFNFKSRILLSQSIPARNLFRFLKTKPRKVSESSDMCGRVERTEFLEAGTDAWEYCSRRSLLADLWQASVDLKKMHNVRVASQVSFGAK